MSAYENVISGKLRLKGKALNVKDGGSAIKKKRKRNKAYDQLPDAYGHDQLTGQEVSPKEITEWDSSRQSEREEDDDTHLTEAERRYLDQWRKIELQRLAKIAKKSHRDRVQEFNQYLANLSEHYDIPKVGPG